MEKKYAEGGKAKAFIKKNMYYIIIGACVLAIGAMITVALVVKDDDNNITSDPLQETPAITEPDNQNIPVQNEPTNDPVQEDPTPAVDPDTPVPIVFTSPVANGTISKDYAMTTVVYWSTLKHYAVHNGIDLVGEEGATVVVSALKGTVKKVSYDALNGNVVEIEHTGGLVTTYGSLENVVVKEGQMVNAGDSLGTISTSATNEMLDGAHVHFTTYLNGNIVDPLEYLPTDEK